MAEKLVVGMYKTEPEVMCTLLRLRDSGYTQHKVSVLAKDPVHFNIPLSDMTPSTESPKTSRIGSLLMQPVVLKLPGLDPFLAAGPMASSLGVGAFGSLAEMLAGLGVDKMDARHYQDALGRGELLVIVAVSDESYTRVYDIIQYPTDEYQYRYEQSPSPIDEAWEGESLKHPLHDPFDSPPHSNLSDGFNHPLDVDSDGYVIDPKPIDPSRR